MIAQFLLKRLSPTRVQFLRVVVLLVKRDLKVKYRDSFFGYLWSMMNPLLFMLVIYGVFSFTMKGIANYHLYVLSGILTWSLATTGIIGGTHSIANGGGLLRKIKLPIWVLPAVPLGMSTTNFALSLFPFLVVSLFTGNYPTFKILLLPVILGIFFLFILGVSLALASLNVFFRDVGHVLDPIISLFFYATPIIFDRHTVHIPAAVGKLIALNPFTHFVEAVRSALMGSIPLNPTNFAVASAYALLSLIFGLLCYKKLKPRIMFRV